MAQNKGVDRLILASKSPVRSALLRQAGIGFEAVPAHVDESGLIAKNTDEAPERLAILLSGEKARVVSGHYPGSLVVGSDQMLVFNEKVLQKPESLAAARARLEALSGKTHQLVTGIVLVSGGKIVWQHVELAVLRMHELSRSEIARHIGEEGETVLQSVGAYRLEGPGIRLFAAIEGDHFAMLGLPLVPLISALRKFAPGLVPGLETA